MGQSAAGVRNRVRGTSAVAGAVVGTVVAAALLLGACGSSSSDGEPASTTKAPGTKDAASTTTTESGSGELELDGTEWRAVGVEGYDPVPDTQLVLTFEDGRMSANAGCNTLGAPYELTDGKLTWTEEPSATMMACSPELEAQDATLAPLFTGGVAVELADGTLTLTSGDEVIRLREAADSPLLGTEWMLDGTIADQAVSSVPAGVEAPTLVITPEGTAEVFAGCNRGSSQVVVGDGTMEFSPMALTRMACEGAAMELEDQVVQVLDGEVEYEIDGETLTITKDGAGLAYTAG